MVNIVSAFLLGNAHHGHDHHGHAHHYGDSGHGNHQDLNLKSAYVHVVADAATSVFAMLALAGGWVFGWWWLDPVMGVVGAVVVALCAKRVIGDTAKVLLDREMDHPVVQEIREAVEAGGKASEAVVTDLHVWRVGKGTYSCALSVVTHDPTLTPARVREWISVHEEVVHVTAEVNQCAAGEQQPGAL